MTTTTVSTHVARGAGRDALIAATLHLIAERGYHAVRMRDVAEAAHLSLGSTTYHFATREDMLRAALDSFTARISWQCQAARRYDNVDHSAEFVRIYTGTDVPQLIAEMNAESHRDADVMRLCDILRTALITVLVGLSMRPDGSLQLGAIVRAEELLNRVNGLAAHRLSDALFRTTLLIEIGGMP